MKPTSYHQFWQNNRIKFILSKYPKEFFVGKTILELGSYNGYIGATFQNLGAKVTCIEGRLENVEKIKKDYSNIDNIYHYNLDCKEWNWGKYDIIINFGLYYHLEYEHEYHLINCLHNCNLMFFESVVYDSYESKIYFRSEKGDDQSLSNKGGTPTTSYIENILNQKKSTYQKYCCSELNDGYHHYDWEDKNTNVFDEYARRFWIINNNLK